MRLDNAKASLSESRPNTTLVVHYHPFMIDPQTAPDGEAYAEYNRRRWGGDGWTHSMKRMGRKEGAPYANWVTWPNTTHCSRLLLLAEEHGMGDAVIGRLYAACYEEGQNVSLRSTVARIAAEVGVPGGEAFVMSNERFDQLEEALNRPVRAICRHLPSHAARTPTRASSLACADRQRQAGARRAHVQSTRRGYARGKLLWRPGGGAVGVDTRAARRLHGVDGGAQHACGIEY